MHIFFLKVDLAIRSRGLKSVSRLTMT